MRGMLLFVAAQTVIFYGYLQLGRWLERRRWLRLIAHMEASGDVTGMRKWMEAVSRG